MLEALRRYMRGDVRPEAGDRRGVQGRRAGVLVAFTEEADPSVTMIVRAGGLRRHAGQVAFPGGAVDPTDVDVVAAALREAWEEVGLDPARVTVLGTLPVAGIPRSQYDVTPVVATWAGDQVLRAVDEAEVASVHQIPVSELLDPAHRVTSRHPRGHQGPAFVVGPLFIWGFSGYVLDQLFRRVGWEKRWDPTRVVDIPAPFRRD